MMAYFENSRHSPRERYKAMLRPREGIIIDGPVVMAIEPRPALNVIY